MGGKSRGGEGIVRERGDLNLKIENDDDNPFIKPEVPEGSIEWTPTSMAEAQNAMKTFNNMDNGEKRREHDLQTPSDSDKGVIKQANQAEIDALKEKIEKL